MTKKQDHEQQVAPETRIENQVVVELSNDEALVLFEWLANFNALAKRRFDDPAEERVLADLEAVLESLIPEVLDPKYEEHLQRARAAVRGG